MTLTQPTTVARIYSIDLLRGIVMIIMALDHTRDYFHAYSYYFDPLDLQHTTPAIYFTRWITHLCAPVFIFLAGTSAFLSGQRKTKAALSSFLFKRGLWLVLLELTLVSFGWFFNPRFNLQGLQVIWVLGFCMIALGALIHLPKKAILTIGLLLVFGHNLLDGVHVPGNDAGAFLWSFLHEFKAFQWGHLVIVLAYPVIPWIGVMALGYCLGDTYLPSFPADKRKRWLRMSGLGAIALFIILRFSNVYGDPVPWETQDTSVKTFLSFMNVNKYPPSLLFLCITLGLALFALSFLEKSLTKLSAFFMTYGRVPLFYYLVHIYLLHFAAMWAAEFSGFDWSDMVLSHTWITLDPGLKGYGFPLPVVYLIWIAVVLLLYPLCRWYDRYKQQHRENWWLSYL